MRRRRFLEIAGSGITLAPWLRDVFAAADGSAATDGVVGKSTDADIRSLFEANREEVLALAEAVFRKCILEKLRPPVEPLQHTWVQPGGPYYLGQWIWDTMFVVDLLSILPGTQHVIRDIFQNYWDFQDRWNKKMPDYARDMIKASEKIGVRWKLVTFTSDDSGFDNAATFVRAELDAGRPVVIDFKFTGPDYPNGEAGHTLAIAGYLAKENLYVLCNPAIASPGLQLMTAEDLKRYWRSDHYGVLSNGVLSRPAIAIDTPQCRSN
jgi:hypothetical protein